jgi:two-component system cell cycle response regulator DivK
MPNETILIVDDNPQHLKLAHRVLSSEGYDAHTAIDAEQALNLLEEVAPELILMDIQLPGFSGLELTRCLKANPATRRIIIVAFTGYARAVDEEQARAAGCDGYLIKPIDVKSLPQKVAGYLNARGSAG